MSELTNGYDALRTGAAWLDLTARGRIRATGEDRKRLLHALTTNHVQELAAGKGHYCFFLNAQGRVLADAILLERENDLLIGVEPETRAAMLAHIDRYIIADDVTLEDTTDTTCEFAIEGPEMEATLARLGVPVPANEYDSIEWAGITIVRASVTGAPGVRFIAETARCSELRQRFNDAMPQATEDDIDAVRLEHGRARCPRDFDERNIAHETGLLNAIHFNKGCYLGQEIVERVRSRAAIHRQLAALRIDTQRVPEAGEKIMAGDKEVGEITSAAWSKAENAVRALGYVRLDARAGAELRTLSGDAAQLV